MTSRMNPWSLARRRCRAALGAVVALAALQAALGGNPPDEKIRRVVSWQKDGVSVTSDFEGGRLNDFSQTGPDAYTAVIAPETRPMFNQQSWYAFRIQSDKKRTVAIKLTYTDDKEPLFYPKTSRDRSHWERVAKEDFTLAADGQSSTLRLEVGPEPVWVAAQELFTESDFAAWIAGLQKAHPFITTRVAGQSTLGRPIPEMEISETQPDAPCVVVLGRQHPPEVTGTFGLQAFVETLAGDSELAREYRKKFRTVVLPLANPDGVNGGHWRYNVNGVDLNRDWDKFTQQETRVLRDAILKAEADAHGRIPFYIDYHSTWKDTLYVNPAVISDKPDSELDPKDRFIRSWLARVKELTPYHPLPVGVSPATKAKKANSVTWVREQGFPSITHEFSHDTDRALITRLGEADAIALMELLLDRVPSSGTAKTP